MLEGVVKLSNVNKGVIIKKKNIFGDLITIQIISSEI